MNLSRALLAMLTTTQTQLAHIQQKEQYIAQYLGGANVNMGAGQCRMTTVMLQRPEPSA